MIVKLSNSFLEDLKNWDNGGYQEEKDLMSQNGDHCASVNMIILSTILWNKISAKNVDALAFKVIFVAQLAI